MSMVALRQGVTPVTAPPAVLGSLRERLVSTTESVMLGLRANRGGLAHLLEGVRPITNAGSMLTTQASTLDIQVLSELYVLRDYTEVAQFVRQHPQLISPLLEAVERIDQLFGASTMTKLDIVRDPESHNQGELYAFIQTNLAVDEALKRLRRFDEGWWLTALPYTECMLTFSLEYT